MTDAAQREYAEALEAYRAALTRLREAKRHFDPQQAPERKAKQVEYRERRRAAWNDPEAKARRKAERERWIQESETRAQAALEQWENMPNALRILTRVGKP